MKQVVYLVGLLTILAGVVVLIFVYAVPKDQQREVLEKLDIEDAPVINEISKAAFVELEVTESHPNLLGNKYVISTMMRNANESVNIYRVGLRYHFPSGYEDRYYDVDLRPGRVFPATTREKIPGYVGEELIRVEVISAE
jgi:hypothetical protein